MNRPVVVITEFVHIRLPDIDAEIRRGLVRAGRHARVVAVRAGLAGRVASWRCAGFAGPGY